MSYKESPESTSGGWQRVKRGLNDWIKRWQQTSTIKMWMDSKGQALYDCLYNQENIQNPSGSVEQNWLEIGRMGWGLGLR